MENLICAIQTAPLYGPDELQGTANPAPKARGVYAKWLPESACLLLGIPVAGCVRRDELVLVYVGIAGSGPKSNATLRSRLALHCRGIADCSTLRLSVGVLLGYADGLRCSGAKSKTLRFTNESDITDWLAKYALISWVITDAPWEAEAEVLADNSFALPLNLRGNAGANLEERAFSKTLHARRAAAKKHAKSLAAECELSCAYLPADSGFAVTSRVEGITDNGMDDAKEEEGVTMTNLDFVAGVLEENGTRVYRREDVMMSLLLIGGEATVVFITLLEDGEFLRFQVPGFVSLAQAKSREKAMERLLSFNYTIKLCSFAYDPNDGEVTLDVGLPLQGSTLSEAQVARCMSAIHYIVGHCRPVLRHIILTGSDPQDEIDAVVAGLLGDGETENSSRG